MFLCERRPWGLQSKQVDQETEKILLLSHFHTMLLHPFIQHQHVIHDNLAFFLTLSCFSTCFSLYASIPLLTTKYSLALVGFLPMSSTFTTHIIYAMATHTHKHEHDDKKRTMQAIQNQSFRNLSQRCMHKVVCLIVSIYSKYHVKCVFTFSERKQK